MGTGPLKSPLRRVCTFPFLGLRLPEHKPSLAPARCRTKNPQIAAWWSLRRDRWPNGNDVCPRPSRGYRRSLVTGRSLDNTQQNKTKQNNAPPSRASS